MKEETKTIETTANEIEQEVHVDTQIETTEGNENAATEGKKKMSKINKKVLIGGGILATAIAIAAATIAIIMNRRDDGMATESTEE